MIDGQTPRPAPHQSFLVTSLGAYDDSGVGTGGFSVLHGGQATVIDSIDSTGLWLAGGVAYRFARGLRSIVGYDTDGLRYMLALRGLRDVHDVLSCGDGFVCAVTGTNEIVWVNAVGEITRRWQAKGERDAWHLNCLWQVDGRLFFSAFGRYATHREWTKGGCLRQGFICELEGERDVVTGLSGPHNPRYIDGLWVVCDSHLSSLVIQPAGGEARRVQLQGFTRGLAHDNHYFYVGESANRKAPVPELDSSIAVVDRKSFEVVHRFKIPFPEIYEIVLAEPAFTAAMLRSPEQFQIGRDSDRLKEAEKQIGVITAQTHGLRQRLENLRTVERLHGSLVAWKRRLVG